MGDKNPYLDTIIKSMNQLGKDWDAVLSGKFNIKEVFSLITTLVRLAETIIIAPESGADKHQLVREAFDYLDRQYLITKRIDDLVPLPIFLEPFDGAVIRKVIDFLIGQAVSVFNATIWKEKTV